MGLDNEHEGSVAWKLWQIFRGMEKHEKTVPVFVWCVSKRQLLMPPSQVGTVQEMPFTLGREETFLMKNLWFIPCININFYSLHKHQLLLLLQGGVQAQFCSPNAAPLDYPQQWRFLWSTSQQDRRQRCFSKVMCQKLEHFTARSLPQILMRHCFTLAVIWGCSIFGELGKMLTISILQYIDKKRATQRQFWGFPGKWPWESLAWLHTLVNLRYLFPDTSGEHHFPSL